MKVRAPGKLMVAGEYAVLHGAEAVVMAVDRHARIADADAPLADVPREVTAALQIALREKEIGAVTDRWSLDVRALHDEGGRKLGLGSSAAACVAAVGWHLAREGHDLGAPAVRARVADLARRGHRAAQGGGSGVDVIASAHGGVVSVRFAEGLDGAATVRDCGALEGQHWAVLWSGTSARTSEMITRAEALRARDPGAFAARMDAIGEAARAVSAALHGRDAAAMTEAVRAHGEAMEAFGAAIGAPVVTDALAALAAALRDLGAAVKPSGAGGGDDLAARRARPRGPARRPAPRGASRVRAGRAGRGRPGRAHRVNDDDADGRAMGDEGGRGGARGERGDRPEPAAGGRVARELRRAAA
ncbi:MAG: hypothetical protein U0325_23825 [Polyangiales bacterium]